MFKFVVFFFFCSALLSAVESPPLALRRGTLHVLAFGIGAPLEGPPVDDLYGRDAQFLAQALKQTPCVWAAVETTVVSGSACTPERLRSELARIAAVATTQDFVIIHASTHGTTAKGLLILEGSIQGMPPVIDANILAASLAALPCPTLVSIDACQAGGAVHSPLPRQSAWLLACTELQSSGGQEDDPAIPHGFQILALCEALRGDADADKDGLITVGEVCAWVPPRATNLARFMCLQDSVVVLPPALASIPLTRVAPGAKQPLWTMPQVASRNPWGLQDLQPLLKNAEPAKLWTALMARDAVSLPWNGIDSHATSVGKDVSGVWDSRSGKTLSEQIENQGRAEIAETNVGFFAAVVDINGSYLIEAVRDPTDLTRLNGWCGSSGSPEPSTPWVGRVIDAHRIDGQTADGVWDFRR